MSEEVSGDVDTDGVDREQHPRNLMRPIRRRICRGPTRNRVQIDLQNQITNQCSDGAAKCHDEHCKAKLFWGECDVGVHQYYETSLSGITCCASESVARVRNSTMLANSLATLHNVHYRRYT